ncbi:PilZ domain-containing protein [Massilia sp. GCM10020059]|uniref:PilZ domain-containing protein n=1 Tax=Massilia agrisoli TaxID=2892444 RepID=A0ABS8IWQ8_9BURK|nr:PilZ domain-containing protein [Massilia agrisoli]MCC6072237.1 PilZ domain-containing protein [Massilia agrisoli]
MASTQLVYLFASDIPVGTALPWPIFLASGDLLAPSGFMVADELVQERLLMATPVRIGTATDRGRPSIEMDSEELSARIASRANDPLKYFRQNAETVVLTFKLPAETEPRTVNADFYGRIGMSSVIVSAPALGLGDDNKWKNFEGMPITVQVLFGRTLCMFKTTLLRYAAVPNGHLFLRYPQKVVTKVFRQALRVNARIPASITLDKGAALPALITNLSDSGCALETGLLLGQAGSPLTITFQARLADATQMLSVPCVIRSVKGKLSEQMRYGVEFSDTTAESVSAALKAFLYEQLAEA